MANISQNSIKEKGQRIIYFSFSLLYHLGGDIFKIIFLYKKLALETLQLNRQGFVYKYDFFRFIDDILNEINKYKTKLIVQCNYMMYVS